MRVSKADGSQSTNLQRDALIAAGVSLAHLYEDLASGRRDDRPGLAACLKALREGDTLIVWKLDRLGRDLRHLINTVHDLTARSVGLKVLTGHGAAVDTTTAAGKLVFGIFAALAEFERELISERTVAGLISARARGRKGGAPLQDDRRQATPGDGQHGATGNQGGRSLRRTRDYPADALPARVAQGRTAARRRKAALPRFSRINGGDLERGAVQCGNDPITGVDPQEPLRISGPAPAVQRLRSVRCAQRRSALGQKQTFVLLFIFY